jgi:hypothetical protein
MPESSDEMRHGKIIIIQSFGARTFAYNWPEFEGPNPSRLEALLDGRSFKTGKHAIPVKIQTFQSTPAALPQSLHLIRIVEDPNRSSLTGDT